MINACRDNFESISWIVLDLSTNVAGDSDPNYINFEGYRAKVDVTGLRKLMRMGKGLMIGTGDIRCRFQQHILVCLFHYNNHEKYTAGWWQCI